MEKFYASAGGMIDATEAAFRLRDRYDQPLSQLGRWIVTNTIVHLEWCSHINIPLFQFESDMTIRTPVVEVTREFSDVFDAWDSAVWFSEPNSWLFDRAPAEAIDDLPALVASAARADRFIARG